MKTKIHNMVEEVEKKVSIALKEEIWRLGVLIDEFNMPFHSEPIVLNIYKRELNTHIENGLGSNLKARLSSALAMNIEQAQEEMTSRMHALIPLGAIDTEKKFITRPQPFEMLYSLNCQNLCSDFQEDLEFRFSWGITAMIQRFTGKYNVQPKKNQIAYNRDNSVTNGSPLTPVTDAPLTFIQPSLGITPEHLSVLSRFAFSSVGSQGTVGGLVVAGIMFKTVGWRLLVGVGCLYGCIYLYERLSWTNSAKERSFKSQFVNHATKKLKMIVDLTSANCSHQVQQELSSTFARLCRTVDNATTDMNTDLKTIESAINVLEANEKQLRILKNKGTYLHTELDAFEKNYILDY